MRLDAQGLPVVEEVENDLKSFQKIVGGLIEVVYFGKDVLCIINEEGKLDGLKPNFAYPIEIEEQTFYDIIVGNCFFVGDDGYTFRSLTDKELRYAIEVASDGRDMLYDMAMKQMFEGLVNG